MNKGIKIKYLMEIEALSPEELANVLIKNGYEQVVPAIQQQNIDGKAFLNLTEFQIKQYKSIIDFANVQRLYSLVQNIQENPHELLLDTKPIIKKVPIVKPPITPKKTIIAVDHEYLNVQYPPRPIIELPPKPRPIIELPPKPQRYQEDSRNLPELPILPELPKLPEPPKLREHPKLPEPPKLREQPKLPEPPKLPDRSSLNDKFVVDYSDDDWDELSPSEVLRSKLNEFLQEKQNALNENDVNKPPPVPRRNGERDDGPINPQEIEENEELYLEPVQVSKDSSFESLDSLFNTDVKNNEYYKDINKIDAIRRMSTMPDGSFLLRRSEQNYCTLVVKKDREVFNIPLNKNQFGFYLQTDGSTDVLYFDVIDKLINHYCKNTIEIYKNTRMFIIALKKY